jgi:hypothetical protein
MTAAEIKCNQCGDTFNTWNELALHIMKLRKTHKNKKHRMWAASYINKKLLQQQVEIKHVSDDPDKIKTEYGNEQRENAKRRLSGEQNYVNAVCPKCHKVHRPLLDCEFIQSPVAWRVDNRLVKLCQRCEH